MRLIRLAPLLAALALGACQTPEVSPTIVELPQSRGYARGIDMPTDASDVVGELQGRRWLNFVARYYRDPASRWPTLTANEARRLSALGLKIVTVWEWHSHNPGYFTYATGYNDALSADRQARGVGQPPGSAIYFAVDFNAHDANLLAVDQYFRGVAAGLAAAGRGRPEYKVGVYGSGAVCTAIRGAGLAQYAWLSGSTAWEGTAGYNGWNIRQAAAGARFTNLSFDHDANEARDDYGGFQLGNYASATPPVGSIVEVAVAAPAAAASVVNSAVTAIVPQAAAAPLPPAPPMPTPAPVAAPAPAPAAPAVARPVPTWTATAVEVAALAAAEPKMAAVVAPPRIVTEPETPPPARRSSERAATSREPPREPHAAHAAKGSSAAKRKAEIVTASARAVTAPARHAGGSPLGEAHEAAHSVHKAAAPRRSEEHGAHVQAKASAAHASERPARHHAEPH